MQITLNETTLAKAQSIAGENGSVEKVVETAVENLGWVKDQIDAGKVVIAANKVEAGWADEEFYPIDSVLALSDAPEATEEVAE